MGRAISSRQETALLTPALDIERFGRKRHIAAQRQLDDVAIAGLHPAVRAIRHYLTAMVVVIAIVGLTGSSSAALWGLNFIAFSFTIAQYCSEGSRGAWLTAVAFLATGLLSVLIGGQYISSDLKTMGMHINLLVTPLYILFVSSLVRREIESEQAVVSILSALGFAGTVTLLFAWAYDAPDYIGVLTGGVGAYQADIDGFFNNKNIYGVFVSLSLMADLYLLKSGEGHRFPKALVIAVKVIAVVLSFSRAALLQCVVAVTLFLWFEKRRSIKEWVVVVILCVGVAVVYLNVPEISDLVDNQILRLDVGDAGRGSARERALDVYQEDWETMLLGIGYAGVSERGLDIDNTYLYELLSGGLMRMAFCLGFFAWSLYLIRRMPKRVSGLRSACMAVLLSYLVYMGFESIAPLELGLINFSFMLFMLVIPAIASPSRERRLSVCFSSLEDRETSTENRLQINEKGNRHGEDTAGCDSNDSPCVARRHKTGLIIRNARSRL